MRMNELVAPRSIHAVDVVDVAPVLPAEQLPGEKNDVENNDIQPSVRGGRIRIADRGISTLLAFDEEAAEAFGSEGHSKLIRYMLDRSRFVSVLPEEFHTKGLFADGLQIGIRPPLPAEEIQPLAEALASGSISSAWKYNHGERVKKVVKVINNFGWMPETSWDVQGSANDSRGKIIASSLDFEKLPKPSVVLPEEAA